MIRVNAVTLDQKINKFQFEFYTAYFKSEFKCNIDQ